MATESQVRRIEVVVNTQGDKTLQTLANGFSKVNKSIQRTSSVLTTFRNAFFAIQGLSFAGIGVREIVQAADAMQKLNDRLNITENSTIGANARLRQLTEVANENFTSIQDAATVYTRLNLALQDIGVSSQDVVRTTDLLQKTFRLSGATAAEAAGATIQLSQGLASGQLRGQELRSVLESNVVIGKILADTLGVTRGELLKIAEKRGGIAATEVLNGLFKSASNLDEQAKKLKPTIQDALIRNFNDLRITINDLNKEFGLTEKVVAGLDAVFNNLGKILTGAAILAIPSTFSLIATSVATAIASLTSFATLVAGSAITGVIVKATTIVAGLAGAFFTLPIAVTAAVTSFVLAFSTIDSFRNSVIDTIVSIKDFISLSLKTSLMNDEQKKKFYELKDAAESYEKITQELNKSSGIFILAQSDLEKQFAKTIDQAEKGIQTIGPIADIFDTTTKSINATFKEVFDFTKSLAALNQEYFAQKISLADYNKSLKELQLKDVRQEADKGSITLEQYNKKIKEIEFGKIKTATKDFEFELRKLNLSFKDSGDISEYSKALNELKLKRVSEDFNNGKVELEQFNDAIADSKIKDYNIQIATGKKEMSEYVQAVNALNIEKLENSFKSGSIGAKEFNENLIKIDEKFNGRGSLLVGVSNYIESAGTLSQNIANGITQTFGRLEDALVSFTQTGKLNFRDFTLAVLEDLNRIIIRSLVIRPLAQAILSGIPTGGAQSPTATTSTTQKFAKGGAFSNGIQKFASGGVVSSPTLFPMAKGTGLAGEAGPEAILPLKRDNQGNLGVKATPSNVTVNVINNSGAQTEQRETTGPNGDRVIDIVIVNKVKEGLASGAFDKQFAQQYGLRRKGS